MWGWFSNRGTVAKLMTAFGLMAGLMTVGGWRGLRGLESVEQDFQILYRQHAVGLALLKSAQLDVQHSVMQVRAAAGAATGAERARFAEEALKARESLDKNFADYRNTLSPSDAGQAAAAQRLFEELNSAEDGLLADIAVGRRQSFAARLETVDALASRIAQQARALENAKLAVMAGTAAQANRTYTAARTSGLVFMAASVLLAMFVGYGISRGVARPLEQTVELLERVARGDLTAELPLKRKDEVGRMAKALNQALREMRRALTEVNEASTSVTAASAQLAHASERLATGAHQQAASLETTAASLVEMTSTIRQNSEHAQMASAVALEARDLAVSGGEVVNGAVGAMADISAASRQIADIVSAMDEIAFQTNLLALNAAVEAARAGEQGRGFAVVAAEVRKLAQRSANSAREIKTLIRDSLQKVDRGAELVDHSGQTLSGIVAATRRVSDIVSQIAAASSEQTAGLEQVNSAVTQIDTVTQSCSTQTEELATTAMSLSNNAHHLQTLVSHFRLQRPAGLGREAEREARS